MGFQHCTHLPKGELLVDYDVLMSNVLIRSAHGLSLSEKRLISAAIAKTRDRHWPELMLDAQAEMPRAEFDRANEESWGDWLEVKESPFRVKVSAADYAKAFRISLDTAYEQLAAAADNLFERRIRTVVQTRKGPKEIKLRWVWKCEYMPGEGWVEINWSYDVAQHIYGYGRTGKGAYTTYKLREGAMFASVYTWRLFEILHSLKGEPYRPNIDDFIRVMDIPESYTADFFTIRRRIIEVAVKELVKKHKAVIDWKTKKAGVKVVALEFTYDLAAAKKAAEAQSS